VPVLSDFEWRGSINLNYRISNVCLCAVEYHLCPLLKQFMTGVGEMVLTGEEGLGTGRQLPPK